MPKVGLAQCACAEGEEPLRKVESYTRRARSEGVELIVFPEALMRPIAGGRTPRELAEPLDGPLVSGVRRVAQSSGVWIIVDVYESRPDSDALPYNTAVVVDDCGEIQDVYRKCHLYDAHGERESDQTSAGDALGKPIHTPFSFFLRHGMRVHAKRSIGRRCCVLGPSRTSASWSVPALLGVAMWAGAWYAIRLVACCRRALRELMARHL